MCFSNELNSPCSTFPHLFRLNWQSLLLELVDARSDWIANETPRVYCDDQSGWCVCHAGTFPWLAAAVPKSTSLDCWTSWMLLCRWATPRLSTRADFVAAAAAVVCIGLSAVGVDGALGRLWCYSNWSFSRCFSHSETLCLSNEDLSKEEIKRNSRENRERKRECGFLTDTCFQSSTNRSRQRCCFLCQIPITLARVVQCDCGAISYRCVCRRCQVVRVVRGIVAVVAIVVVVVVVKSQNRFWNHFDLMCMQINQGK